MAAAARAAAATATLPRVPPNLAESDDGLSVLLKILQIAEACGFDNSLNNRGSFFREKMSSFFDVES